MVLRDLSTWQINNLIDELFVTTAESIYDTDMQHGDGRDYWPFHPVFLNSLVAPFVFEEFYRLLSLLSQKGYTLTDIGKIIKSPTKVANYQYLWPIQTLNQLSFDKKCQLAKFFIGFLVILRNGDPFCSTKRNLVWSREELAKNISRYESHFIDAKQNRKASETLSKLEALLVSYAETLYYYMIDLSRMMHGPYKYLNHTVFVKEYLHLKAGELWETVSDFPFDHYQEIGFYPSNMKIEVFFMGHTHSNPSFPKALRKFVVIVDGKVVKVNELSEIYMRAGEVVEKAIEEITKKANDTDFLLKRGIDMFFYPLKPLYDEVGENWKDILPRVYKFAEKMRNKIKIPHPWGDWSREKAVGFLLKQMDFRKGGEEKNCKRQYKEKRKGLFD